MVAGIVATLTAWLILIFALAGGDSEPEHGAARLTPYEPDQHSPTTEPAERNSLQRELKALREAVSLDGDALRHSVRSLAAAMQRQAAEAEDGTPLPEVEANHPDPQAGTARDDTCEVEERRNDGHHSTRIECMEQSEDSSSSRTTSFTRSVNIQVTSTPDSP